MARRDIQINEPVRYHHLRVHTRIGDQILGQRVAVSVKNHESRR